MGSSPGSALSLTRGCAPREAKDVLAQVGSTFRTGTSSRFESHRRAAETSPSLSVLADPPPAPGSSDAGPKLHFRAPPPAPAAPTWLSAQLLDAPRCNAHTHPWTPPTNWLLLSLPWGQEKAISWAWARPGGPLGSSPPKPHIHPWSEPRGPRCLNIPHLSESKRSGKIVRGRRWEKAPIPQSVARCPHLPTAPLLSWERLGGPPPLLATSPPGGLLPAPLWSPVPPLLPWPAGTP